MYRKFSWEEDWDRTSEKERMAEEKNHAFLAYVEEVLRETALV